MSYQFVHVECYSRKRDDKRGGACVASVLAEARRDPGSCPHVPDPRPPGLVFGADLTALEREHDARAEAARAEVRGGKARRIRSDQQTLLTAVASYPTRTAEVRAGGKAAMAAYQAWESDAVRWLRAEFGDELRTVVRHTDEEFPHIHAYAVSRDPAMAARALHPGIAAKLAAVEAARAQGRDGKAANREGDRAYRAAMVGLQNRYHEDVGAVHGQTRRGPGRRRLSRPAWVAEQQDAKEQAAMLGRWKSRIDRVATARAERLAAT